MCELCRLVGVEPRQVLVEPRHRGFRADPTDIYYGFVRVECPPCGTTEEVRIPVMGYVKWVKGELIQEALGELCPRDREKLQSGLCDKCQDEVFGEGAGKEVGK